MNGIIVVNKPKQMTSHDVVNIVRKAIHSKKVGHTGTLDPDATGVLVLAINDATKLIPFLEEVDKTYLCEITIGYATTTEDASGVITSMLPVESMDDVLVDHALSTLVGTMKQTPPMYSAVKVDGKKLYQYARNDQIVERPQKDVTIYELKRTSDIVVSNQTVQFSFIARVSKGTYIRTLCVEIGTYLGFPAHMKDLVRLKSGKFSLEEACSIEEIKDENIHVIPMVEALGHLPKVIADSSMQTKISNGVRLHMSELHTDADQIMITNQEDGLLAIYEKNGETYKAVRVWK
jgi:tRNA pseudouridine55 synthase